MELFDRAARHDTQPKLYSEESFSYYNRSARPAVARIREVLQEWFDRYPVAEQEELWRRFRADFAAAFFELFLHELLRRLGIEPIPHPFLDAQTKRRPDFLAVSPGGKRFLLEATLARDESVKKRAERRISDRLKDEINKLDLSDFMLGVHIIQVPQRSPSARRIRAFLENEVKKYDADEIVRACEREGSSALPVLRYSNEGLIAEFQLIPVKPSARGKRGRRAIGIHTGGRVVQVKPSRSLTRAIRRKATKYGELDVPYVIAVNAVGEYGTYTEDIVEALYGEERIQLRLTESGRSNARQIRVPGGVWLSPRGQPRHTRVSAVMIANPLTVWNIPKAPIRVYENPWATNPLGTELDRLPRALIRESDIEWLEGSTLGEIIGLPDTWPHPG